jgi:hypothetical protein
VTTAANGSCHYARIPNDTLAEIHAALPPNLVRSDRQPANPPKVVEIWFADT